MHSSHYSVIDKKYNSKDKFYSTNATKSFGDRIDNQDYRYLIIENYLIPKNQELIKAAKLINIHSNERITIYFKSKMN